MPPKKAIRKPHPGRRADALGRLRERFRAEHEDEVWEPELEPTVTPALRESIDGGIPRLIEALRMHDEVDARDFLEMYDGVSAKDMELVTLEEIAHAAGIGSLRLAEIAQTAIFLHGQMKSKLLLHSNIHKVINTSLKQAVKPMGLQDREWALRATGYIPTPKNQTIFAPVTNVINKTDERDTLPEPTYLHPEERLRMIHEKVEGGRRLLPSPTSDPLTGERLSRMQDEVAGVLVERESDV